MGLCKGFIALNLGCLKPCHALTRFSTDFKDRLYHCIAVVWGSFDWIVDVSEKWFVLGGHLVDRFQIAVQNTIAEVIRVQLWALICGSKQQLSCIFNVPQLQKFLSLTHYFIGGVKFLELCPSEISGCCQFIELIGQIEHFILVGKVFFEIFIFFGLFCLLE